MSAPYKLSANQQVFVEDARMMDFDVDYTYSGRFMYGKQCPAVIIDSVGDFGTSADTLADNMGKGFVVYCPR